MASPSVQEAAKGLIDMATPPSTRKFAPKSTTSSASSNKSGAKKGANFVPINNSSGNTPKNASAAKTATPSTLPSKGTSTPSAKSRKDTSSPLSSLPAKSRNNTPSPLSASAVPNVGEQSIATSTDTDYIASDYAADHANNGSEAESPASASGASVASASTTSLNGTRRVRPQATPTKAVNKSLKRVRGQDGSVSAAGSPAKRVRSTVLSRQAPRATSGTSMVSGEFTNFTATIFMIKLGSGAEDPQFHVHETVLTKSPRFVSEIAKAKSQKRSTKHNVLLLDSYDTIAFEQMVAYLYTNDFKLKNSETAILRIQEIHELFSLAGHFQLPELQKKAVKTFSKYRMLAKVTSATFFDWAEDMYYEELDKERGPFIVYFRRVAPMLLQKLDKATVQELCRVVRSGGGFCVELFKSCFEALQIKPRSKGGIVKKEEDMSAEQLQTEHAAGRSNERLFVRQ